MTNILFLCRNGTIRSRAFSTFCNKICNDSINFHTYKGTHAYYEQDQVKELDLIQAKIIYLMDLEQKKYLMEEYGDLYLDKCVMIGVSDDYDSDDDVRLLKLVRFWIHQGVDNVQYALT